MQHLQVLIIAVLAGFFVAAAPAAPSAANAADTAAPQTGVGAPPPENAILLSQPAAEHLRAKRTGEPLSKETGAGDDGVITIIGSAKGVQTAASFTDFRLHVEWFSPPGGFGQLAGNSGVFMQGIYEIQVLGTPPAPYKIPNNEAGALYKAKAPDVNASTGPGTWQAYDVVFKAARYEGDQRVSQATITVWWNGQLIHHQVPLAGGTSGGYPNDREKNLERINGVLAGPIYLQAHKSLAQGPVQYRNLWIKPITESITKPLND